MGEEFVVEYSTNNSGGSYWLRDKDWEALRNAGWLLMDWDNAVYTNGRYVVDKSGLPTVSAPAKIENAHYAFKKFTSITEALKEFEELTGQDVTDEGCNCCGAPHSFTWGRDIIVRLPKERLHEQDYNFASGEDLAEYLYDPEIAKLSKRELIEKLTTKHNTSKE